MKTLLVFAFSLLLPFWAVNATPSAEVYRKIEKLHSNGAVLYFAAHPDDENTALLYFLSHEAKLDTAYLSLTRGDGGQNRIGTELGKELGFIRTQELLGARSFDWSQQFFSRAVDFGYSKTVKDTLQHWDEDSVLRDAVYLIRKFKPDLIITRFHPEREDTHGHHTTSAVLALRAFQMAADPLAFPEQLSEVMVHQTRQICWDSYRWGQQVTADEVERVELPLGSYDALFGASIMEFSRQALAYNKSQGTVFETNRSNPTVRLEWLAGESIADFSILDLIAGSALTDEGRSIATEIHKTLEAFDFDDPSRSLKSLSELRAVIESWPPSEQKQRKLKQLKAILGDLLGFFFEIRTQRESVVPGGDLPVTLELVNRSAYPAEVKKVELSLFSPESYPMRTQFQTIDLQVSLEENQPFTRELTVNVPADAQYTQPYWISEGWHGEPMFRIGNTRLLSEADNPPSISATLDIVVDGVPLSLEVPVIQLRTDIFRGEVKTPVSIVPTVSVRMVGDMMLFTGHNPQTFQVELKASQEISGVLQLEAGDGWQLSTDRIPVSLKANESRLLELELTPVASERPQKARVHAKFVAGEQIFHQEIRRIEYPHIESQPWLARAEIPVSQIDLRSHTQRPIAYVQGAGDKIPEVLRKVGFQVDELTLDALREQDLSDYSTIVFGIRVFDVHPEAEQVVAKLEEFVRQGGTWLVQYHPVGRGSTSLNVPVPFTLSRGRVSDETAAVALLHPEHVLLNEPNAISLADFEGWVQERGLYFASEWDDQFTPLLSCNDVGESPLDGGLLVAPLGEGRFIYTGYSFFRQLPAGVPGAIRLFVNLISNPEN